MAETETPKKGGKAKKEKKAKAPKPKKEKKPKAPKPKKEKKPKPPKPKKEKKPKPPKPKKEKKPKKGEGAGGEEGEGKRGPNKKLLILLIGIVLLMGIAAFLVIKVFKLFPALAPEDPVPTETSESAEPDGDEEAEEPGEDGEPDGDKETEPPGEDGEPSDAETAPPEDAEPEPTPEHQYPTEIHTQITNAQVMEFIESLSPSLLGLEGEDMSGYEMFASDNVSIIDGIYCTQVRVYSKNPSAGTNDIEGIYFVSRGNQRLLYRYDEFTETVTEIPLH